MRKAGATSWRFAESIAQLPHVALYVRDSVGLLVPSAPDVPPVLANEVPDRTAVLDRADRAEAGQQWLRWWRQVTDDELKWQHHIEGVEAGERARGRIEDLHRVADPPDFDALADSPALRVAVAATFTEACRWRAGIEQPTTRDERGSFAWSLIRDVAEDVAFDHRVDVGELDGAVLVLAVHGVWSCRSQPGGALCSSAAAADRVASRALLYDVFSSQLKR